ncbi:NAD(P)-dependent dehydrogenase (short-subunit alcohol dehydrogenase family) [Microbacterium resistens]|uniref:NAD(P)-dependent dehydrogenase (Short-subunit alcohol dehydrogenase family) n=1 Tax=Microbacterium resistens TaxID=156977 RepID=A0ABU1SFI9_9MICO|nr:SDR family oxidoreductase [Microbacterium resistens]MDR6868351.1 NAD(P)-dependent dehydrogenase (short-subunit alcohol dehydrogenase family) [Microbacterium resistens]
MDPMQSFRLDGRCAVVTGASSGLGARFARVLAAAGADLLLVARRADRLERLADELRGTGRTVVVQRADVADVDDVREAARRAQEEFGRIDVLVNNAGIGTAVPASRETPESFRSVIDVNLNGTFWMAQACAPSMPPGSSIINVSSVLGHIAPRFPQAAYAASKAGVLGLTRDLAQEWTGRKGIRVNALCPGYFASEMTDGDGDQIGAMVREHSIMGRLGEAHELDGALLFLASPASSYVTGTSLLVDGGMVAL